MINGLEKLLNHIERLENVSLERPVGKAIGYVQAAAKENCPTGDGELRSSIFTKVEIQNCGESAQGICYTNKSYGPYVEFGTGPKGQEDHSGISPHVDVAYSQSPWWIHESQIDRSTAEKYHWFYIDTKDGRFYQCSGQPAHPFMYPALKNHEDDVVNIIQDDIRRQLR